MKEFNIINGKFKKKDALDLIEQFVHVKTQFHQKMVSKIGFRAKCAYFLFRQGLFRSTYQRWSEQEIQRCMNKKDDVQLSFYNTHLA
jgi:hypothetical protein